MSKACIYIHNKDFSEKIHIMNFLGLRKDFTWSFLFLGNSFSCLSEQWEKTIDILHWLNIDPNVYYVIFWINFIAFYVLLRINVYMGVVV